MIQNNLFENKKGLVKYINNEIYKVLKEYGYKRKGNDFYMDKGELTCLINIQKARFPEKDEEEFTLNWALCFPMCAYFYDYGLPKMPSFGKSFIGHRIACLKKGRDLWWTIHTDSSKEERYKVLEDIKHYLKEYGVPFLAKLNSIEDVIIMLETIKTKGNFYGFYPSHTNPEPFQAILYSFINRKEKALEIMNEIIATTKSELYRENMIGLKEKIENFDPTKYKI